MAQINIALDDQTVGQLDRVAAAKGLRRPELLRTTIAELIEAHDAGRLMFQSEAAPQLDASVSALVQQLQQAVIELDRSQRENQKQTGRLIEAWNGGAEANRKAQDALTDQINAYNEESYRPFVSELKMVRKSLADLPVTLAASLEPQLGKLGERIETNNALAREPRTQHNLVLGDDRTFSLKFLSATYGLAIGLGAIFALIIPGLFHSTQLAVASRLIAEPAQMCRLIEQRYGAADCAVPKSEKELGLRVIAHEARQ